MSNREKRFISLTFLAGFAGAALATIIILTGSQLLPFSGSTLTQTNIDVTGIDVTDVVAEVNPAVVSIVITEEVPIIEEYYENPFEDIFGSDSPFGFSIPRYRQNGTEEQEVGGGSGFLISSDGYVVTNAHVIISDEADYSVLLNDETSYEAEVIATDEVLDVALLKIETDEALPYVEFGDSDELELGQGVIAIGNALGEYRNTVSTGVISGLSRSIVASNGYSAPETLDNVIQTDAAINPGNSGGPLLDFAGRVVGINVAVASGSENIGFALPANAVRDSIESMKENGRVIRPYLGVRYIPVTESVQEKNSLEVDYGALILRGEERDELAVLPGSPADKAGLEEYDIILEIDGERIDEEHTLESLIRDKQVGDTIELKVLHDGDEKTIDIKLEERPE